MTSFATTDTINVKKIVLQEIVKLTHEQCDKCSDRGDVTTPHSCIQKPETTHIIEQFDEAFERCFHEIGRVIQNKVMSKQTKTSNNVD